jgi:hypothetical protein
MAPTRTLFAWACPAFTTGSPVDHTWVTTYDNRTHADQNDPQVAAAGESYWYCWGSFHAAGGTPVNPTGFLGSQVGDLTVAQCLVQANADSQHVYAARGTIFTYGKDGVCHQLANQVLYSTGTGGARPMTVQGSRGYQASIFVYGTYGRQHVAWVNKVSSCGAPQVLTAAGGIPMAGPPDEFEARARQVLGDSDPETLAKLLALRVEAQRSVAIRPPGAPLSAEALNAQNQRVFDEAARILGPRKFEEIFGFPPGAKIDLVDPTIKPQ